MSNHDIQASGFQPQTGSPKAYLREPRPFQVTFPGQEIASSPTNPFPRRPHEVSMGNPAVAPNPANSIETQAESTSELELLQFSLYAEGQTPPHPPQWQTIQAKLAIGPVNDPYEQEANQVADQVMRMPQPAPWVMQRLDIRQPQRVDSNLVQAAGNEASSTSSGLQRVQAATAANDLEKLKTIQKELRQQMLTDPLHPPEDARAGLATARHWTMDQIAVTRDKFQPELDKARTEGGADTNHTGAMEAVEIRMDEACTPYLNVLTEGDPQYRYEHFKEDVRLKVFDAVRLHAVRRGVGRIGHRAEAEEEARAHANLPSGSWCGAFAYTQAEQGGGFDPYWAKSMQGEGGIRGALAYSGAMNPWIWVFDHWEKLKDYHAQRGSLRWYKTIEEKPPIKSGDLVLIDNAYGVDPDHITTAISYDGRFLTTVGGNQGSSDPKDETGVSRNVFDLQKNPKSNDVTKRNEQGQPIDAQGNVLDPKAPDYNQKRVRDSSKSKNTRIHGIGRWSIVDYESHVYSPPSKDKPAPPSTAELTQKG